MKTEQEKKFLEGVDAEIDEQLWAAVEYSGRAKAVEVAAIVKACNCHYELLEAMKDLYEFCERAFTGSAAGMQVRAKAKYIITKAEGKIK